MTTVREKLSKSAGFAHFWVAEVSDSHRMTQFIKNMSLFALIRLGLFKLPTKKFISIRSMVSA